MNPEIFSIEIRPGVFVRFHGIPWDLTQAEARKVAGVIEALATLTDASASAPHTPEGELGPGTNQEEQK